MKIIDEKGKLFGKLNLIDLLVVVILIAAILFLAFRFTRKDANPVNSSTKLTYTTLVANITPEVYEEVQRQMAAAGGKDQLMASGDLLPAYVTKVEARPHAVYQPDDNGVITASEEQGEDAHLDLVFTIEANVVNPIVNEVGPQEVRVGKSHVVKTVHFEFTYGSILTCDWG